MLITYSLFKIDTDKLIKAAVNNYFELYNYKKFDYSVCRDQCGKPFLLPQKLHVSVSHSNKITVVSVSRQACGIDIEYHRKNIDFAAIGQRFFQTVKIKSEKEFYELFTLAECSVKKNAITLPKSMKQQNFGRIIPFFTNYTLAIESDDDTILLTEYHF